MVNANVKIIEELKVFLNTVIENPDIKCLFTNKPADFTRETKIVFKKSNWHAHKFAQTKPQY